MSKLLTLLTNTALGNARSIHVEQRSLQNALQPALVDDAFDVRFGSKADMCAAKRHVCFTPNSDRESEIPQKAMSALPPKADMCGATRDVRFGPKAILVPANYLCTGPPNSRRDQRLAGSA